MQRCFGTSVLAGDGNFWVWGVSFCTILDDKNTFLPNRSADSEGSYSEVLCLLLPHLFLLCLYSPVLMEEPLLFPFPFTYHRLGSFWWENLSPMMKQRAEGTELEASISTSSFENLQLQQTLPLAFWVWIWRPISNRKSEMLKTTKKNHQKEAKPTYTTKKNQTAEGKSLSLEKRWGKESNLIRWGLITLFSAAQEVLRGCSRTDATRKSPVISILWFQEW